MKSTTRHGRSDEIEVLDEGTEGRIRIREWQGSSFTDVRKCSIRLTPDQLEEHARACVMIAKAIRSRQ